MRRVALFAAALALGAVAHAQTQVWFDTNGSTAGTGNTSVTWGTNSGNYWSTNSAGSVTGTRWNSIVGSTTNKNATFSAGTNGTGAYTVTVSGTIDYIGGLTFEEGTVTLTGGTLKLRGASNNITVNSTQATVASVISGAAAGNSITKLGSGTLTLSGANTFQGGTTLSAGSLAIGNNAALGTGGLTVSAATTLLASGGARSISNSVTANSDFTIGGSDNLTFLGAFSLGSGNRTLTISNTGVTTISGAVSNGYYATFTKAGNGTLVLSGNNTFSGPVAISQGALQVASNNALGAVGSGSTIASGAELQFSGGVTVGAKHFSSVQGTGTGTSGVIRNMSGTNSFSGNVTLGGASTFGSDAGTLTLSGNVSNGGYDLTTVGAGNLSFTGNIYGSGGLIVNGSGTTTIGSSISLAGGLNVTGSGAVTLAGTAASTAAFNGSGTTTITGTVNGATTVNSGTVYLNKSGGGALAGTVTIDGGTVQLGADDQFTSSSTVNLTSAAGTLDLNNHSTSLAALNLTGATVSTGTGTLTIANSGSSSVSSNASSSAAAINGKLALAAFTTTFNVADGAADPDLTIGATISNSAAGTHNILKSGDGKMLLTGTNTFTGSTTVSQGTLAVGANAPSGANGTLGNSTSAVILNDANTGSHDTALTIATSGVTVGRNVTVANNGSGNVTLGGDSSLTSGTASFTGDVALNRSADLQAAGTTNATFSGVLSGSGGIEKTGTGTVTLSTTNAASTASNTFTGGVTVTSGTLAGVATSDTTKVGGFKVFGDYSGVTTPTDVITVASGATLSVQGAQLSDGNASTHSFWNLVLNGTGDNGGGALRATGGNSTWTGNTVLGSDATITNAGASGDPDLLFLGAYTFNTDSYLKLNNHTLNLNGTGDVFITSKIGNPSGDTGSIVINGGTDATTVYFGGYANSYTGDTTVNRGVLQLLIDPSNPTNSGILGNLTIGSGSGSTTAKVMDYYGEQISDSSTVTINKDGTLDLSTHGVLETIGTLVMNGGHVDTGTGELHIASSGGPVSINTADTSTIDGKFRFQGTNGVFNVANGSTLMLNADLFGTNVQKTGTGTMVMTFNNQSNGYTGTTTVSQGTLNIRNSGALGGTGSGAAASGTTVASGATLQLENTSGNVQVGAEALTISGSGYNNQGALDSKSGADNRYGGAITLANDATIKTDAGYFTINGSVKGTATTGNTQTLTLGGAGSTEIHGSIQNGSSGGTLAISKIESGTAYLSGADTFTGAVDVSAGRLEVTANNVLGAQTNAVNVASGATFAVSGGSNYTNTIGAITGSGTVSIAGSTNLVVNTTAPDSFSGTLSGTGLFKKTGASSLTFTSASNTNAFNFGGTVQLDAGTMQFNGGTLANSLSINTLKLNGGTLFLNASTINVTTLNITADTILDFGTGAASILNATNIYIAAGVTLTVKNWSSESDFLFANSVFKQNNGSGTSAVFNAIGTFPENQVKFYGTYDADGSYTTWINYGYNGYTNWEIRPIPEPSTYGAILLGGCLGLFAWFRLKRKPAVARK